MVWAGATHHRPRHAWAWQPSKRLWTANLTAIRALIAVHQERHHPPRREHAFSLAPTGVMPA
jgi:hypothetical protein